MHNCFLAKRKELYEKDKQTLNFCACSKELTELKKELEWLKISDKCALQNALKDLDAAYKNFFEKRAGYPKFKSKKTHRHSYRTTFTNNNIECIGNKIKLPKLGWVKTRDKQMPQGRILNATISQEPSGKYYCSICCTEVVLPQLPKTNKQVGIDLGIKEFAITSDGIKIENPKYLQQSLDKLVKMQRELSRKTRGGSNWNKARIKVARQYEKISNQRKDFLQKLSTKFIRDYDVICLESLDILDIITDIKGTNKEKARFRRNVSDVSWYEFNKELEYKAKWYGREITSSQLCHCCGHKNPAVKDLSVREWTCPKCGIFHDRDVNAAKNILNEGLRIA